MANINHKLRSTSTSLRLGCAIMSESNETNTIKYDFEVSPHRGPATGNNYYGSFSFNGSKLTGKGIEFIKLDNFDLSFLNFDYSNADLLFGEAVFRNGNFLGLIASSEEFSFVSGFLDLSEAYFAYDINSNFGAADLTFCLRQVTDDNFETLYSSEASFIMGA
ncbi:MAG: hypothetical protein F6K18_13915 [Okeania sp. SIO2C2]|uniref:hypothetical protein n=1 Tax=Okeania sp. SIO2C2 TaxID=2607787 RepID=UPI0013B8DC43|nr:hypothetical protein [Okeania sp. SIO2C2]NEP87825.1 hypothetical protein [Okeania sp. SIO2C2]